MSASIVSNIINTQTKILSFNSKYMFQLLKLLRLQNELRYSSIFYVSLQLGLSRAMTMAILNIYPDNGKFPVTHFGKTSPDTIIWTFLYYPLTSEHYSAYLLDRNFHKLSYDTLYISSKEPYIIRFVYPNFSQVFSHEKNHIYP